MLNRSVGILRRLDATRIDGMASLRDGAVKPPERIDPGWAIQVGAIGDVWKD